MPETVIIGIDGTERGEDAAVFGLRLAALAGARLLLTNVVPYDDLAGLADDGAYRAALLQGAEAMLGAVRDRYGIDAPTRALSARSPARALHELAEEEGAALVVVGSSHVGPMRRVLPGSTGERLLHGAPCPVAVVPRGLRDAEPAPIARIGCAVDGGAEAAAALRGAIALARGLGAGLEVSQAFAPDIVPVDEHLVGDLTFTARRRFEQTVATLPDDLEIAQVFVQADPVELIVRRSHELDLLVLGSRGYGPLRAVLLGGVSGRVIREAACPVIVVPRGVDVPLEALAASGTAAA